MNEKNLENFVKLFEKTFVKIKEELRGKIQ